jgi:hypothetical protein
VNTVIRFHSGAPQLPAATFDSHDGLKKFQKELRQSKLAIDLRVPEGQLTIAQQFIAGNHACF